MRTHRSLPSWITVLATMVAVVVVAGLQALPAGASPQVTVSGNPANNRDVTVSGSGFPARDKDPTGVQIIECSDPQGTVANLPTTAMNCDGATQNPLPVNTDAQGNFTTQYTVSALTGLHGTSNIPCDATHYCVLWVGVDYNQEFLGGPHAFSPPFEVGRPVATSSSNSAVIWIPIVAVVVIAGGAVVLLRRRRPGQVTPPPTPGSARTDRPPVRT